MAEIAGGELVHGELVEEHVLGRGEIGVIAGGAVESEVEAQPVALGAAFRALLLGRPCLRDAPGD